MNKIYGTLEIKTAKDTKRDPKSQLYVNYKRPVFIVSGFQPSTMLARIIPDSWADKRGEIQIDVNLVNTEHIDWLMKRYPLDIKQPRKWKRLLTDLAYLNLRKEKIQVLQYATPRDSFQGELKDFQKQCLDFLQKTNGNALVADEMGLGKAQPLDAKILTPVGWKKMGELQIYDQIIGQSGKPTTVIGIYPQGLKLCYKVIFNDGAITQCCEEHLWNVKDTNGRFRNEKWKTVPLKQIKQKLYDKNGNSKHFIPLIDPIEFETKSLPIEPYLLGALLGDGNIRNWIRFTTADQEILEIIKPMLPNVVTIKKVKGNQYDYGFTGRIGLFNPVVEELKKLNLIGTHSGTKFIPEMYLYGSIIQRQDMLQGLLDTDGYISKQGTIQFSSNSEMLVNQVIFLIRSLGGIASFTKKISASNKEHFITTIALPDDIIPFRLNRKLKRFKPRQKYKPFRCIRKIEIVGYKRTQCIKVENKNGLYVTDDFIVTHNTVETLAYLSTVTEAFPAIVIAPLIVLRNWKSEIKRFLKMKIPDTVLEDEPSEPRCYLIRSGKSGILPPAEFYIINYELVAKRLDDLIKLNPKTMILDEIQNLRNMGTGKFNAIDQLSAHPELRYRIGLSGTPIYNRGSEIWGIVDIIQKGILGSYYEFARTYCWTDYRGKGHVFEEKQKALSELLQETIMIRRKKQDVLSELPEKTRYKQEIDIDREKYEEEIQKIFSQIEDAKQAVNNASKDERKTKVFQLNAMYQKAISSERQSAGIAKAPYVVKYIKELMELDEKIVVFCHHKIVHEILMNGLKEFNPCHIIGGQTDNQRQEAIDTFQNTPVDEVMEWNKRNLLIAGLRAGNVGINLTAASYVIFAELDWSPAIHRQAEDRLHRIGQKNAVFAHYLVGEETLDETIVNVLVDKALEIDAVMGDEHQDYDQERAKVILEKLQSKILQIKSK